MSEALATKPKEPIKSERQFNKVIYKKPHVEIRTIYPSYAEILVSRTMQLKQVEKEKEKTATFVVKHQRKINEKKLNDYTKKILEKKWMVGLGMISVSTEGLIINGLKTLLACIKSGKPIKMVICFGVDPQGYKYADDLLPRGLGNMLYEAGFKNQNAVAAIVRFIYGVETISMNTACKNSGLSSQKAAMVDWALMRAEKIQDHTTESNIFYKKGGRILTERIIGGCYWLMKEQRKTLAKEFWERLAFGEGIFRGENIYTLRKRIEARKESEFRYPDHFNVYDIVQCWNLMRENNNDLTLSGYRFKTWKTNTKIPCFK